MKVSKFSSTTHEEWPSFKILQAVPMSSESRQDWKSESRRNCTVGACVLHVCVGLPYVMELMRAHIDYAGSDVKREDDPMWQTGRMAYHCPRCNAGYTYKKTLKTHMKYDCGKEPRFKCPYCNKRDKCSSNIYKHVRMRHDGLPVIVHRNY